MTLVRVLRERWSHDPLVEGETIDLNNLSADIFRNFECKKGCISIFEAADPALAPRIAIAIAALRKGLDDVHYCTVPNNDFTELALEEDRSVKGETPDGVVNQLHFDVRNLSARGLSRLVEICAARGETHTIRAREVKSVLARMIADGSIQEAVIQPSLKKVLFA